MGFKIWTKKWLIGGLIRFVGNSHVYQTPKNNCLIVQLGHTKHCPLYKYIYFGIFGDQNEWCSKPQYFTQSACMYHVQRESAILKIFHAFPRCHDNDVKVTLMTSSSKFCVIFWRGWFKSWLRPCWHCL